MGTGPKDKRGGKYIRPESAKPVILELLREGHNVSRACKAIGLRSNNFYSWRQADAKFDADVEAALVSGARHRLIKVEDEITERALYGVEEPVFYQGKQVGTVRKHSNWLLVQLAGRLAPEAWRAGYQQQTQDPEKLGMALAGAVRGMLAATLGDKALGGIEPVPVIEGSADAAFIERSEPMVRMANVQEMLGRDAEGRLTVGGMTVAELEALERDMLALEGPDVDEGGD